MQAEPPTATVAPVTKLVPVIVSEVPPAKAPPVGSTVSTVGCARYVYAPVDVPVSEFDVTTTSTAPAACVPVVHVIDVGDTTVGDVQVTPPIAMVAPVAKPAPVIVTLVAPVVIPLFGERLLTVGGAM